MDPTVTREATTRTPRGRALLWALAAATPFAILALGLWLRPDIFYDRFLWQDIWGPLLSDASQAGRLEHNGIIAKDGYTITSEITYGVILAVLLYTIYKAVFVRYGIQADGRFVLGLLPFILLGPVARSLEDASTFCMAGTLQSPNGPCDPGILSFFFISPVIYMQEAVFVLLFLLLGVFIQHRRDTATPLQLTLLVGTLELALASAYAFIVTAYEHGFMAVAEPWVVYAAALLGTGIFAWRAYQGQAGINVTAFALGLPFIVPALWLVGRWVQGYMWVDDPGANLYPDAGAAILGLAITATATVALLAFLLKKAPSPKIASVGALYLGVFNLALVFGHMLDAFATYVALEDPWNFGLGNYSEKHPVSDFLLGIGDGLGFPLAKITMILAVIWILDREFKEEEPGEENLVGLIKMAIFILGFAPGLRDLLRVAMGI